MAPMNKLGGRYPATGPEWWRGHARRFSMTFSPHSERCPPELIATPSTQAEGSSIVAKRSHAIVAT
jgi:hypothetical protein